MSMLEAAWAVIVGASDGIGDVVIRGVSLRASLRPQDTLGELAARLERVFADDGVARTMSLRAGEESAPAATFCITSRIDVRLACSPDRLSYETAEATGQRFLRLLEVVVSEPNTPLGQVVLLSEDEHLQLKRRNETDADFPADRSLHELIEMQAFGTPDALALIFGDIEVTYAELDARAERMARRLALLGVRRGSVVGVHLDRGPEMVVALLGVLKAGGAYLMLDTMFPACRLEAVARQASVEVVVTDIKPADGFDWAGMTFLELSRADGTDIAVATPWRRPAVGPDDLACVMFTSGSTGTPKGVATPHRALVSFFFGQDYTFFGPGEVVLQCSPVSWDVFALELFGPLLSGGVCVLQEGQIPEPRVMAALSVRHGVTSTYLSSTLFSFMLDEYPEAFRTVRQAITGGEPVPPACIRRALREHPELSVINGYSPLECTILSVCQTVRPEHGEGQSVPIGTPMANMRVYVLDAWLRLVAPGVVGELYLAGAGLARGYVGRPDLTAERFVADPFGAPGERMYRSGDLARWGAHGEVEFVGRVDQQVKVRGFRVEPGEVEAVVEQNASVRQVAVIAREDRPGDKRLVAYVVPQTDAGVDIAALRASVARILPDYMVPSSFVELAELPMTANGKLDRIALPAPDFGSWSSERAPMTTREEVLCALFSDVLGVGRVGVDDNFFHLGGHSLLAMRLISRLHSTLGVDVSIRELFRAPTVAGLAELLDGTNHATPESASTLAPVPHLEHPELSFAQQRLWFLGQLEGPSATYNIPVSLRLTGTVDPDALHSAIGDVMERHEALRTVFPQLDGLPFQQVVDAVRARPALQRVSCSRERLSERLKAAAGDTIDITIDVPLRAWLFTVEGSGGKQTEHVLLLVLHHIAGDGWSMRPLIDDLFAAYASRCEGVAPDWDPLPIQYIDYSIWQRQFLGDESDPNSVLARQVSYWRDALSGAPQELDLPTDRPRPAMSSYRGAVIHFTIGPELHERLLGLARAHECTLFMVLQAAVAVLLVRSGAGEDIPIGTPVAGRSTEMLDNLVGFFVNTVVLRTDASANPTFVELLDRTRTTDLNAFDHQDLPFERLVELLNPERSLSRHPIFQVMVALDSELPANDLQLPGLEFEILPQDIDVAKYDLSVDFTERLDDENDSAGIQMSLEYATDLFDHSTAQAMGERILQILDAVSNDPGQRIGQLEVLLPDERRRLLETWNGPTRSEVPVDVAELVRRTAAERPSAVAVSDSSGGLSYRELAQAADRISAELGAAGVGSDTVVAVLAERSPWFIIRVLGVLGAGASYMPLDPGMPVPRAAEMLNDADVRHLLASPELQERAEELVRVAVHDVVLNPAGCVDGSAAGIPADLYLAQDSLAYVVFTSGSTGRPKGVLVPHRGLSNHLVAVIELYGLDEHDVIAFNAPLTFDVSIWQTLTLLATGGRVHIVDDDTTRDPLELLESLKEHGVTVLQIVPGLLRAILDTWDTDERTLGCLSTVRWMLVHGEVLPTDLLARWFARFPDTPLVNVYGPAECSDDVSISVIASDGPALGTHASIGPPLLNTKAYVLDKRLQMVPPGVVGELYIAGAGLARGYAGRPDLTAERFVASPFGDPGERMYRSGDLARWSAHGELEFVARVDQQVKVRGFRVEPGEIEALLARDPSVRQVAVLAREDRPGNKRLVAYVVPHAHCGVDVAELRTLVGESLPEYMVPSAFVVLSELPTTASDKLDRAALPEPDVSVWPSGRAARTPREEVLCALFGDVLSVSEVGIDDNFFHLGGHSLLAMRLISRLRAALGAEVRVRELFRTPTVAGIAKVLTDAERPGVTDSETSGALVPVARPERPSLSYAQQRLWLTAKLEGTSPTYNIPVSVRMPGTVDPDALQAAIGDVADRHETLRTVFPQHDGLPFQRVVDAGRGRPMLHTVVCEREGLSERMAVAAQDTIDVTVDLPLRAWLFTVDGHGSQQVEHVLLLVVHHIAADGWSLRPLIDDLLSAYASRSRSVAPAWEPLSVQYIDYSIWQRRLLGEESDPASILALQAAYWRTTLVGPPLELELPTDRPRPVVASHSGATVDFAVDPDQHKRLLVLARSHGCTLFMVLHAAVAVVLTRAGAGEDIPIGTPVAGRSDEALDDLVGFFVNTVVLRTDTSGDPTFAELLDRTRTTDLDAYDHQDLPFERLVELLNPERSLSRHPIFQVMVTLDSEMAAGGAEQGLVVETLRMPVAKFDLTVDFTERRGDGNAPAGLRGSLEFATDLFDRSTVQALSDELVQVLREAAADPTQRIGAGRLRPQATPAVAAPEHARDV